MKSDWENIGNQTVSGNNTFDIVKWLRLCCHLVQQLEHSLEAHLSNQMKSRNTTKDN